MKLNTFKRQFEFVRLTNVNNNNLRGKAKQKERKTETKNRLLRAKNARYAMSRQKYVKLIFLNIKIIKCLITSFPPTALGELFRLIWKLI